MLTSNSGTAGGPDADDEIDALLLEQLGILAGVLGARGAQWSARRLKIGDLRGLAQI